MKSVRRIGLTISVVGAIALALVAGNTFAQVKKGKTRPMTTQHLMAGVFKVHCGALKKQLDAGAKDEKEWKQIELHAALLNESSYILMADGRCPDGVWAKTATGALRTGSMGVLTAVKNKDLDAAKAAFGAMTKSCGGCHKAHKKKKKKR